MTIVLSPHSDDACFSLGVFVSQSEAVCVINIFTVSGYESGMHGLVQADAALRITELRESEDCSFAQAVSLRRLESLRLLDAPLRGLNPLTDKPSERELAYVSKPLAKKLDEIYCEFGHGALLLAPAGIGDHVDHLTVRDWVLRNFENLSAKYYLGFYEDLHYASDPLQRTKALRELLLRVPDSHALNRIRISAESSQELKRRLLTIYKTQLPGGQVDLGRFIPAENHQQLLHEAFWIAEPKIGSPG